MGRVHRRKCKVGDCDGQVAWISGPPIETRGAPGVVEIDSGARAPEGQVWVTLVCDGDKAHAREYEVVDGGLEPGSGP